MNATFVTELSELSESTVKELRRHNLLQTLVQRRVVAEAVAGETISAEALQQAREQL